MIKLPNGNMNFDNADKCITAATFLWWFVNMILKHIVISYANIYLKEGIMQYKVLKINKTLTFSISAFLSNFVANNPL